MCNVSKLRVCFRTQTVSAARAEAEKIRLLGDAEAQALEAIGISEAERMRMKAAVYKKYGDAAILNITLNALPKVSDAHPFRWNNSACHSAANDMIHLLVDRGRGRGAVSENGRDRPSRWKRLDQRGAHASRRASTSSCTCIDWSRSFQSKSVCCFFLFFFVL